MNSCHGDLVWLVNSKLSPVKRPMRKITFFGPYLSRAHPAPRATKPARTKLADEMDDVIARVRLNSLSIDLKNRPKDDNVP